MLFEDLSRNKVKTVHEIIHNPSLEIRNVTPKIYQYDLED